MTIWFDIEDLFEYARAVSRPSGIQRLSYEVYAVIHSMNGADVGFLRHDPLRATMRVVDWQQVEEMYRGMTNAAPVRQVGRLAPSPVPILQSRVGGLPLVGAALRGFAGRLPAEVRRPLGEAARAQIAAFREGGHFAAAVPRALGRSLRRRFVPVRPVQPASGETAPVRAGLDTGQDIRDVAKPGDVLATLGAPWWNPDYSRRIAQLKSTLGLRYALLIYDLIPLMRPEYCNERLVAHFAAFIEGCMPLADELLAISHATANDVVRWTSENGIALPQAPRVMPIGTGFSTAPREAPILPQNLVSGSYVLFVSTMEARKNHLLAFRAWRCLLDSLPAERVPHLVFAGRIGAMVEDLLHQLQNSANLDGKVVLVEDPDDETLAALYRGASFTLFPSLYEGWGLPVSESLAFGKVCLASNSTSLPEAGGDFCLYHDPDSVSDAVTLYRRAIEEPTLIATLEARIAAEYRPTPWSRSAEAVLAQFTAH